MTGRRFPGPVEVVGTDLGCCVSPPGVGDEVSWLLMFLEVAPAGDPLQPPNPLQLEGPGLFTHRWRVERSGAGVVVVDGPVTAAWAPHGPPPPDPGEAELTGLLVALFHGGFGDAVEPPAPVRGTVERVRVVSRLQVLGGQPERLEWVPGSTWSYDVARSPKYLAGHPPRGDAPRRVETGILVDLTGNTGPSRGARRDHGRRRRQPVTLPTIGDGPVPVAERVNSVDASRARRERRYRPRVAG